MDHGGCRCVNLVPNKNSRKPYNQPQHPPKPKQCPIKITTHLEFGCSRLVLRRHQHLPARNPRGIKGRMQLGQPPFQQRHAQVQRLLARNAQRPQESARLVDGFDFDLDVALESWSRVKARAASPKGSAAVAGRPAEAGPPRVGHRTPDGLQTCLNMCVNLAITWRQCGITIVCVLLEHTRNNVAAARPM